MAAHWRQMTAADLDAVARTAAAVHPRFFERTAVLAEKQRLYPAGAWLCEQADRACGYLLSHPWHEGAVPPLDTLFGAVPVAGTYYLHDLALMPEARGSGVARAAVEAVLAHAVSAGFPTASLVAVNGSQQFWTKCGFVVADAPHLAASLAAYESDARYMVRNLR